LTLAEFKALVREQYDMLLIDQTATLAAIPELMPGSEDARSRAFVWLSRVLDATGGTSGEAARRLLQVGRMFGIEADPAVLAASKGDIEEDAISRAS
jgi:hypothetical protein